MSTMNFFDYQAVKEFKEPITATRESDIVDIPEILVTEGELTPELEEFFRNERIIAEVS